MITVNVIEKRKTSRGYVVTLRRPSGGSSYVMSVSEAEGDKYIVGAQVKIPVLNTSK